MVAPDEYSGLDFPINSGTRRPVVLRRLILPRPRPAPAFSTATAAYILDSRTLYGARRRAAVSNCRRPSVEKKPGHRGVRR